LRNNSKSATERLYVKPKSPENTPKNAKISTETKSIENTKTQAIGKGPVFTFSLAGVVVVRTPATVSYGTDQVHFKHEQSQVLLIESHVTIGMIQQTQDAASVLEYIDTVVGMRLDQPSY